MRAEMSRVVLFEEEEVIPSNNWNSPLQTGLKRILELVLSVAALVITFPMCALLGIGIKLTSPGPIFYRCEWIGKDSIPFVGHKLRTMVKNADELKQKLMSKNEMTGPVFKITGDPRITKLGAWIRRHSIDEIPQLWSVVKGDMSVVGPRPPLRTEYEKYTAWEKQKLLVKPGITCLWQVSGRNRICDFDEWIRLDFAYISNWSFWLDLQILLKTIREVLLGSGK